MGKIQRILFGLSTALLFVSANASEPTFGRYVGILKHDRLEKDQLAKIDFITVHGDAGITNLKAILTLHFGDFKSGEYVSYHFDDVKYNAATSALIFDHAKEDVTIVASRFQDGELVGKLRSGSSGQIGEISLKLNGIAKPTQKLMEPLNGEYTGTCDGENATLQIHTFRSTKDTARVGSPFAANEIRAQIGQKNYLMCEHDYPDRVCNKDNFNSGSYDFYKGDLRLNGDLENLNCRVNGDTLQCDTCILVRQSGESRSRVFSPATAQDAFGKRGVFDRKDMSGVYRGYVHHEYLDTYQPIEIDLSSFDSKVSATATLFFGTLGSSESIGYRFESRDYPETSQFVLSRMPDDVDAILKVTSVGDGIVQGEWYSLLFGRVGMFEARKDGVFGHLVTNDSPTMDSVGGLYVGDKNFELNLEVFQGSAPPNTDNPFYPLQFGGTLRFRDAVGGGLKEGIQGGSYDFYTGRFGVFYGNQRLIVGTRLRNRDLQTIMTSHGFGTVMPLYSAPRIFRLVKP